MQDADRLDAIGAIGIMRCAAYSGVKGRALLKIDGKENMASAEGHFDDKLLKIKDMMKVSRHQGATCDNHRRPPGAKRLKDDMRA